EPACEHHLLEPLSACYRAQRQLHLPSIVAARWLGDNGPAISSRRVFNGRCRWAGCLPRRWHLRCGGKLRSVPCDLRRLVQVHRGMLVEWQPPNHDAGPAPGPGLAKEGGYGRGGIQRGDLRQQRTHPGRYELPPIVDEDEWLAGNEGTNRVILRCGLDVRFGRQGIHRSVQEKALSQMQLRVSASGTTSGSTDFRIRGFESRRPTARSPKPRCSKRTSMQCE